MYINKTILTIGPNTYFDGIIQSIPVSREILNYLGLQDCAGQRVTELNVKSAEKLYDLVLSTRYESKLFKSVRRWLNPPNTQNIPSLDRMVRSFLSQNTYPKKQEFIGELEILDKTFKTFILPKDKKSALVTARIGTYIDLKTGNGEVGYFSRGARCDIRRDAKGILHTFNLDFK